MNQLSYAKDMAKKKCDALQKKKSDTFQRSGVNAALEADMADVRITRYLLLM